MLYSPNNIDKKSIIWGMRVKLLERFTRCNRVIPIEQAVEGLFQHETISNYTETYITARQDQIYCL